MAIVDQGDGCPTTLDADAVRWLDDAGATDPTRVGTKAANLAVAGRRGLPIVDGFAVTVDEVRRHGTAPPPAVREQWERLAAFGSISLVVRSSSTIEDLGSGSMAGVFASVVDVRGWPAFLDAYAQVVSSASGGQMAVLVQRLVRPERGGVLFGVDPVSGRTDRIVIAAVAGGPHRLVGGEVAGHRVVVSPAGRVVASDGDAGPVLTRRQRHRLLRLARSATRVFGGPQDLEWAIDRGWPLLLQARPVTAAAERGEGPLLGPGPVAETFPGPLTALEADLWLPPLRDAMSATLSMTGSAGRRQILRSPVLTVADGYAVVDLELTGVAGRRSRVVQLLDPRPSVRRLSAAWRVGRLRGALPALARRTLDAVDGELTAVPAPDDLDDDELLVVLENIGTYLRSLHGHEMLVGALLPSDGTSVAGAALAAVARGRAQGWSDEDILARTPVTLAIVTPGLGARPRLPDVGDLTTHATGAVSTRESLRLRIRWLHELSRQVVRELARRASERGGLGDPGDVVHLSRGQLPAVLRGERPTVERTSPAPREPVPQRFRLSAGGAVVAEAHAGGTAVGASSGRASGPVASSEPAPGDVLVVGALDPGLAPLLAIVAGVVAETGSPLSHLAILARERGVPAVVGCAGARQRFPAGSVITLDGATGQVGFASAAIR